MKAIATIVLLCIVWSLAGAQGFRSTWFPGGTFAEVHSAVTLNDTSVLAVGYTVDSEKYRRSASIIAMKNDGTPLWKKVLRIGTLDHYFTHAFVLPSGNIFCLGMITDNTANLMGVLFSPTGQIKTTKIFQADTKIYPDLYTPTLLANGLIAISGFLLPVSKQLTTRVLLVIDTLGNVRSSQQYSTDDVSFGKGVVLQPSPDTLILINYGLFFLGDALQVSKLTGGDTIVSSVWYQFQTGITNLYSTTHKQDGTYVIAGEKLDTGRLPEGTGVLFFDASGNLQAARSIINLEHQFHTLHVSSETKDHQVMIGSVGKDAAHLAVIGADGSLARQINIHPHDTSFCQGNFIFNAERAPLFVGSIGIGATTSMLLSAQLNHNLQYCSSEEVLSVFTEEPFREVKDTSLKIQSLPWNVESIFTEAATISDTISSEMVLCQQDDVGPAPEHTLSTITLLPNPVLLGQPLSIGGMPEGRYAMRICDRSGATILHEEQITPQSGTVAISTTGLASGLYFVELADANSFVTLWRGKVVVE